MGMRYLSAGIGFLVVAGGIWAVEEHARAQQRGAVRAEQVFDQRLADIERDIRVLKLTLEPGASSPAHAHPAHVTVYVTKGSIVSQVGDGEKITYQAGEIWYEPPNATHATFQNPSTTESAEAVAFFIIEEGRPATTLPVAEN